MSFSVSSSTDSRELRADELKWVARVRQGDELAMSALVGKHRQRLVHVAANLLRDAHEAEDVSQEAFIKAFREINRLREDRAFSGYLYRICVRLCMDRLRARKAEPSEFDVAMESKGEQVENRVVIERLLTKLTPDLRITIVLREVEQFSYEEVAEAMNVPVGTVRSRLHSAREKLRQLWMEAHSE